MFQNFGAMSEDFTATWCGSPRKDHYVIKKCCDSLKTCVICLFYEWLFNALTLILCALWTALSCVFA